MNSIPISNTSAQVSVAASSGPEPRENNLLNRSAIPLGKESACQDSQKKRHVKIAIATIAVLAAAVLLSAGSKYSSSPINCKKVHLGFSGELECKFENGGIYNGSVNFGSAKGVLSGYGCYTNPSEEKFCGRFKDSRLLHEGKFISMRILDQCKLATLTDCFAALRNKDCETIEGHFSGKLECEYDDGAKYDGYVKAGEFLGEGCYTNPYGEKFCGRFKKNEFEHYGSSFSKWILDQCKLDNLTACARAVISQTYYVP